MKKQQTKSLLSKKDIQTLKSFCHGNDGDYNQMLEYLEAFIENGIENGCFSIEEARADLELALWYSYACNNLDDYEHYYIATQWMPDSEKNASGCGVWYYRFACSLMYCGRLQESLAYAEKGILEEPGYPWGYLELAKLRNHFGNREGALEAIRHGLLLKPDNYEFLTAEREIKEGRTLEEMEYHYIDPSFDQALQDDLLEDEYFKKLAVSSIVCNEKALEEIKTLFSAPDWKANCPYCTFTYWTKEQELKCMFRMNEATLSKMDLDWLKARKQQIDKGDFSASIECEGEKYLLDSIIFDVDCTLLLSYIGQESGKGLCFKIRESALDLTS